MVQIRTRNVALIRSCRECEEVPIEQTEYRFEDCYTEDSRQRTSYGFIIAAWWQAAAVRKTHSSK